MEVAAALAADDEVAAAEVAALDEVSYDPTQAELSPQTLLAAVALEAVLA